MKSFLIRHPILFGIAVFFVTAIGGSFLGYFLAWLPIATTGHLDPYHGGMMLATGLFGLSIATSIVLGIAFGIYCKNYLKRKLK